MSFGLAEIAALMPEFLAAYPDVSVDLSLSDEVVDLIGSGFDAALRIAALPDSSLRARRLRGVNRFLVAAPDYLERHGRPAHPSDLPHHACLCYAYLPTPDVWPFIDDAGKEVRVRPTGPLRANNADALMPALLQGFGLAVQPDFVAREALADGRLEAVMPGWYPPPIALHLVMPPGGPRPARVEALAAFLTERLSR
jgi:DNA-binding transcriptional LysR family regulator